MLPYVALGAARAGTRMYRCGVEAAIAGVVFGLLTPTAPVPRSVRVRRRAPTDLVDRIETSDEVAAEDLARYARETASPLERIEGRLNLGWRSCIVPLFALANAGVRLDVAGPRRAGDARASSLGLVLGKTIGVFGGAWLAVRLGVGRLPASVTWRHMVGLAVDCGHRLHGGPVRHRPLVRRCPRSCRRPRSASSPPAPRRERSASSSCARCPRRATRKRPQSLCQSSVPPVPARRADGPGPVPSAPWAQIRTYPTCRCSTGRRRRRGGGRWLGPGGPGCSWSRRGIRRPRAGTCSRTGCGHRST